MVQLFLISNFSVIVIKMYLYDSQYKQKDILQVNNAGVNFNLGSDNSVEYARKVITTNYFGTKNMTEAMIPMMKPSTAGARIVSVSSRLGRLNGRRNVSKSSYCALLSLSLGIACWDGFLTWKCSLEIGDLYCKCTLINFFSKRLINLV